MFVNKSIFQLGLGFLFLIGKLLFGCGNNYGSFFAIPCSVEDLPQNIPD